MVSNDHGLRTPREEIAFPARPKIQSQSQIFRYVGSIFCLPHRPNFSDIFDLCLHWVSVVRANDHFDGKATHLTCFYLHINFEQKYPKPDIVSRESVSMGAAGAQTCRSLGHHLLHPLILRLLVLCAPAVLRSRALQDAPAPADPNF